MAKSVDRSRGNAFGTRTSRLCCGDQSIYWDDFAVSIDVAQYLGRHEGFQSVENWEQSFPTRLHSFRVDREFGYYLRLLKVLEHMRSYECSDHRDKVFAALGMAADVGLDEIKPDYQKSVEDVYTDVVRFVLGASELHCFDFLGYVVRPEGLDPNSELWVRYKDLPTWVPDWRTQISSHAIFKHKDTDHPSSERLFCAGGSSKAEAIIDGRKLLVKGLLIDAVKSTSSVCNSNLSEGGLTIPRKWRESMSQTEPYIRGESVCEAFDRTIVTDVVQEEEPHDNLYRRDHRVDWFLLEGDALLLDEGDMRRRHLLEVSVNRVTYGRRMFWTDRGYLGIGPASMAEHDIICLFFGGQVLYVLRDAGLGVYECVGECYVHGLMDGEALTFAEKLQDHTFAII